jgi:hypothetical protein
MRATHSGLKQPTGKEYLPLAVARIDGIAQNALRPSHSSERFSASISSSFKSLGAEIVSSR